MEAKSGQFTASETEERPVPLRKPKESGRRESCEKNFISRSYSEYALSLLGEGECCYDFGERVCQFVTGKSKVTEDPLEASRKAEGEVSNIPERLWLKNAGAVERRARAD